MGTRAGPLWRPGQWSVRNPHPGGRKLVASLLEDVSRAPVSDDPASGLENDRPVDERQRLVKAMLDEDGRDRSLSGHRAERLANECGARRIEVGGRLIEEEQAWIERQGPRQRQALLLSARQRVDRMVTIVRKADGDQRRLDQGPDRLPRHASVLQAEGHVVAGAGHDQLRSRILEYHGAALSHASRILAVEQQLAL